MSDGLLLHRGVHDHTLKIFGLHGLNVDSRLDGGLEQLLQPLFAQVAPEATDLRGVAGQTMLVVIHAAEKLPQHVLAPTGADLLIAEVEAVLEVEQADQQPNGQPGPTRATHARTHELLSGAPQVMALNALPCAVLAFELRRQGSLDLLPRQTLSQHGQRIPQINHRIDSAAKKVQRLHSKSLRNQPQLEMNLREISRGNGAEMPAFMRGGGILQGRPSSPHASPQKRGGAQSKSVGSNSTTRGK